MSDSSDSKRAERLERARRELLREDEQHVVVSLGLIDLAQRVILDGEPPEMDRKALLAAITSLRERFSTLCDRLYFLDWLHPRLMHDVKIRQRFGNLLVRDLHVDAMAVMDAAAQVILTLEGEKIKVGLCRKFRQGHPAQE